MTGEDTHCYQTTGDARDRKCCHGRADQQYARRLVLTFETKKTRQGVGA